MKVIFKKHGNFILYGILPLLFLAVTIAFIELSPKVGRSAGEICDPTGVGSDECNPPNNSLGEDEFCNEVTGKCQTPNVGCEVGVVEQTFDTCNCVLLDDDGNAAQVLNNGCIICPAGQVPEANADGTLNGGCVVPDTLLTFGEGQPGCSLNKAASVPPGGSYLVLAALGMLGAFVSLRRRAS